MNNQELIKLRNEIMDCFTCDEEIMEGGDSVIESRIDNLLNSTFVKCTYFDKPIYMLHENNTILPLSDTALNYHTDDANTIYDLTTFMRVYKIDPSKITNVLQIGIGSTYAATCNGSEIRIDFYEKQISWQDSDGDWCFGQQWTNNERLYRQLKLRGL